MGAKDEPFDLIRIHSGSFKRAAHCSERGTMKQFLTVVEVLDLLRISRPTLGRYVKLARQGGSDFPLPIQTGVKTKRLWHPAAIERWSEYQQSTPVATATTIPSPVKMTKLQQERRAHTEAILAGREVALNATKTED